MTNHFVDFKTWDGRIIHFGAPSVRELLAKIATVSPADVAWYFTGHRISRDA